MTKKQETLLLFIRNKVEYSNTAAPTFTEMKSYMGVTSNQTIDDLLVALQNEGYIERVKGQLRGIYLTLKGKRIFDPDKYQQPDFKDESTKLQNQRDATSPFGLIFNTSQFILQVTNYVPTKGGGADGTA